MPRERVPKLLQVLTSGAHYLIPVAVLLYHLLKLRRSPELSAFHAIWVLAIIMILQRVVQARRAGQTTGEGLKIGARDIVEGMAAGGRGMVAVALATAAAGIIVGVVSLGLGAKITGIIALVAGNSILMMLVVTAIVSLIVGMGLPTTATYIVVASLVAPAIVTVGEGQGLILLPMAAHLFCFYFGILADDTPPVGLAAYAAAAIAKSPPIPTGIQAFLYDIRTAILPFMFIFNADLILHNVDSWPFALLIFATACLGSFAFAALTQGWFLTTVKLWEAPFFLLATVNLMRPDLSARLLDVPHEQRYWTCLIGVAVLGLLMAVHWRRASKPSIEQSTSNDAGTETVVG
jgi:TRAP transporter 4TM/12TM fusion protein